MDIVKDRIKELEGQSLKNCISIVYILGKMTTEQRDVSDRSSQVSRFFKSRKIVCIGKDGEKKKRRNNGRYQCD
ncbi:MAG: hypothetical protein D6732_01955 [Methanobacteriota archaeon]|nr:MAG: hypothetical protein D6732_01955 [Euryarchaeota archaeon]